MNSSAYKSVWRAYNRREPVSAPKTLAIQPTSHDTPIDRGLMYLMVALVPTIPFAQFRLPTGTYYLPFVAAPVAGLAYWGVVSYRRSTPPFPLARQAAFLASILCAWAVLSLIWSEQSQTSRVGSLAFYLVATAVIPIFHNISSQTLYRSTTLLLALMVLLVLYGLYLFAVGQDHWFQFTSETASIVGTRNSDAFMVATIFPLALSRAIVSGLRASARLAAGACGALCTAAVLLSLSRSSTVGLIAAALVTVTAGARLIPVRLRTILIFALLSIGTLLLLKIYFADNELSLTRFGTIDQSSRIPLAQTALDTGLAHPLTGVGYFEFSSLNPYGEDAHDAYLNLFAELGFPGLALFITMLGAPLVWYARMTRLPQWGSSMPTKIRILYLQGFGMLVTLALLSATDTFYKSIYFWIVYMMSIMHLSSLYGLTRQVRPVSEPVR